VKRPSIAILSEQTLFRESLGELLRARGFREASRPELLIVDLDHQKEDAATLFRRLRQRLPDTRLVVIGSALRQAATDGGFVGLEGAGLKALLAALGGSKRRPSTELQRLRKRWSRLTTRQREVLRWLAIGSDNQSIAKKLRVGERAVKAHVTALLNLFSLENRTQLALLAWKAGLAPDFRR
jgi:DNA-binding NarL/FixJ family response regulator